MLSVSSQARLQDMPVPRAPAAIDPVPRMLSKGAALPWPNRAPEPRTMPGLSRALRAARRAGRSKGRVFGVAARPAQGQGAPGVVERLRAADLTPRPTGFYLVGKGTSAIAP